MYKPTPELLRKCAEELFEQKHSNAQVAYTSGGDALVDYFHANADNSKTIQVCWPGANMAEKSMLCLFFAEFLEGEK